MAGDEAILSHGPPAPWTRYVSPSCDCPPDAAPHALKNPPATHPIPLAPQALEAFPAVGVTDCAGKRISGVRGGREGQRKQPSHHFLHLLLGGLAVPDDC